MLCIQSKDRELGGTSSDFRVKLQQPISGVWHLQHALIPNTVLSIRPDNQTLRVQLGGASPVAAQLPVGYYDCWALLTALTTLLQGVDGTLSAAYEPRTARFTVARSAGTFALLDSGLLPVIGYSETAQGTSHTATEVADLTRRQLTFNIVVDCPGVDYGITDTKGRHSSSIIPNTENSLDYVNHNAAQTSVQAIRFRSPVRELRVALMDSEFNAVDLQGAEWHMVWGCAAQVV